MIMVVEEGGAQLLYIPNTYSTEHIEGGFAERGPKGRTERGGRKGEACRPPEGTT